MVPVEQKDKPKHIADTARKDCFAITLIALGGPSIFAPCGPHACEEEMDLLQLPNYHIYLKLVIDGVPSKPFSATTMKSSIGKEHQCSLIATCFPLPHSLVAGSRC